MEIFNNQAEASLKPAIPVTNSRSHLILFSIYILALSIYFYRDTITLFPSHIHAWTQSDRYALALGFLDNGFDFFHPQTFNLATQNGITRVDFPIHEYLVAGLMYLFNCKYPVIFRGYLLLYSIIGLMFLYRLVIEVTSSVIKSHLMVLFVFTTPCYTYYQDGFLPTIPSIANTFIAYYFFFKAQKTKSLADFGLSILFFTLAALSRMPFTIFLFATFCQRCLEYILSKKVLLKELLVYSFAFSAIVGYFLYNEYLGKKYGSSFLATVLPASTLHELKFILKTVKEKWTWEYFTLFHYLLFFGGFISFSLFIIKRQRITWLQNKLILQALIVLAGASIYFLLMAQQFVDHEYYFLDSFFVGFTLLAIFLLSFFPKISSTMSVVLILLFSTGFVWKSTEIQSFKYTDHSWNLLEVTRKNFTGADKFLDSMNVSQQARILVIDAYSTNLPLVLMNRKGHTLLNIKNQAHIDSALSLNCDFIVIQDHFLISHVIPIYPGLLKKIKKVAGNGKISLFKLNPDQERSPADVHSFLGIEQDNSYTFTISFDKDTLQKFCSYSGNSTDSIFFSSPKGGYFNKKMEFGTSLSIGLNDPIFKDKRDLLVEGNFILPKVFEEVYLVVCMKDKNNNPYYYQNHALDNYVRGKNDWQKVQFLFHLPPVQSPDDELGVYLWNRSGTHFFYDDFSAIFFKRVL